MHQTLIIKDSIFLNHLTGRFHPESPDRILVTNNALDFSEFKSINSRVATTVDLLLCHTKNYLNIVQGNIKECRLKNALDGSFSLSTGDVQICPESDFVARYAVGAVLKAIDAVMNDIADNAFVAVRPPGHHASADRGMGFCLYNNVAIGARYLQKKYGLKRVLIVDFDVHHGNGTQDIFYHESEVFYFSTHNGLIFPRTGWSDESGQGPGFGFNLNYPIDPRFHPRNQVLDIFHNQFTSVMDEYKPEFVLISAGFDAHYLDPLGGFDLTTNDFVEITKVIMHIADKFAQGKLVSVLEGGYSLEALADVIPAHVRTLNKTLLSF